MLGVPPTDSSPIGKGSISVPRTPSTASICHPVIWSYGFPLGNEGVQSRVVTRRKKRDPPIPPLLGAIKMRIALVSQAFPKSLYPFSKRQCLARLDTARRELTSLVVVITVLNRSADRLGGCRQCLTCKRSLVPVQYGPLSSPPRRRTIAGSTAVVPSQRTSLDF